MWEGTIGQTVYYVNETLSSVASPAECRQACRAMDLIDGEYCDYVAYNAATQSSGLHFNSRL